MFGLTCYFNCLYTAACVYSDTGQLKMILKSGCVKVDHARQKKCWNVIATREENFGVRLYELKETNTRPLFPREDEIVTLEHNTNQEIEII